MSKKAHNGIVFCGAFCFVGFVRVCVCVLCVFCFNTGVKEGRELTTFPKLLSADQASGHGCPHRIMVMWSSLQCVTGTRLWTRGM